MMAHTVHDDREQAMVSPDSHVHIPKPYNATVEQGRKRLKNESDRRLELRASDPYRRRTKKDALEEENLMNAASQKIMFLNAENSQLRARLEQALIENTKLQLALEQERQLSQERESSNKTLRLMVLEERIRSKPRVHDDSLYQGLSANHATVPPPPVVSPGIIGEYRTLLTTAQPVLVNERLAPRESVRRPAATMTKQFHSQLTAQRVRRELSSIIERSSGP